MDHLCHRYNNTRRSVFCATASLLALCVSNAYAQTGASTDGAVAENAANGDVIVVTARRREERLQAQVLSVTSQSSCHLAFPAAGGCRRHTRSFLVCHPLRLAWSTC